MHPGNGMNQRFSGVRLVHPETVVGDHGGVGPVLFRRLMDGGAFQAPIDFVDYTIVPPGSSIGLHKHKGNDELYFVIEGSPIVTFADEERILQPGDIAVIRDGESHTLKNDTARDVTILVVQARYERSL